jgi:hypothetical protein
MGLTPLLIPMIYKDGVMRFDDKSFGFLNDDGEYLPGWTNITWQDLEHCITALISQGISDEDAPDVFKAVEAFDLFLRAVGLDSPTEPVMGIKVDEGDLLEQVNGPAIFAQVVDGNTTGGAVLKTGDYVLDVIIDGTSAKIGNLEGDIVVEEYGEGDDKYCSVTFEFYSEILEDNIELSFVLDTKNRPEIAKISKGKLKKIVKDGGLADLLRPVPSGESFVKPRDLEVGEYSVLSIEENDPHPEYGRSWKVVLEGVGPMMTTGKRLNNLLSRQDAIYKKWLAGGNPLTFAISNKEEMTQGVRVDCGFFKRAPRADRMVKQPKPMVSAAPELAELPEAETTVNVPVQPVLVAHEF